MSSRPRKIVDLALKKLKDETSEDENSADDFSSFDSDLDPMFLPSSEEDFSMSSDASIEENKIDFAKKKVFKKKKSEVRKEPSEFQPCCSKSLQAVDFEENAELLEERTQEPENFVPGEDSTNRLEDMQSENEAEIVHPIEHLWKAPVGAHKIFEYSSESGLNAGYAAVLINELSPYKYFRCFVDEEIVNEMVHQTNLYATQVLCDKENVSNYSRLHKWFPTDQNEMLKFIGIVAYMGMVRMPSLEKYWSTDCLYKMACISKIMSRNRFQLLLRMWHFSDNETCTVGDRLHKIKPLLDRLVKNFQSVYTPGRIFCIDESVVPFQGRLLMKQYIPNKTHKYGVKLFKLCCENGYTWNIRIYAGKEKEGNASVPTNVVLNLSENLLDTGRTIVADNYYTSLELANVLLDRKTHYIGTLRANRRGNPKEWKDKRDVLVLSTKHTTETVDIQGRDGTRTKPRAIVEYNGAKSSIDQSDQMASYHSPLRKSLKWYRKLGIEFLLGTALLNSHIVFNQLSDKKMKITEFRENLIRSLLFPEEGDKPDKPAKDLQKIHTLLKKQGPYDKMRKYCKGCYSKKLRGEITKNRVK
ncbi:piggyBac transposable element-derived protein 4-like [Coccinella septempunctata]|uniref:piggyBac transposable element-derived protein 4-like n=1 Tax=Coccinella septempunctata TaxID=41139 RepID=UPI001D07D70C|nr:piggyBac transposable element-derived protein 4-like [Coccinella septempunctata]